MRAHALTHKRAHPYPYRLFFFLIIAFNQLISVFLFFSLSFNLVLFFFSSSPSFITLRVRAGRYTML